MRHRNDRDDYERSERYGRERSAAPGSYDRRDEALRRDSYRGGDEFYRDRGGFREDDRFVRERPGRGSGGDYYERDARDRRFDDAERGMAREYYNERSYPGEERYENRRPDRFDDRIIERRGPARSRLRCRDIMTRDVTVAGRETTLREVAAMMRDDDTGVIPVVEQMSAENENPTADSGISGGGGQIEYARSNGRRGHGRLVGLITDRDIVLRAVAEGKDSRLVRAEEVMTVDVHTAQPNDRVIDVIRQMGDKQVRRIPVVDNDGNLRGIISMADIALETEEDRELANALEEISSGSSFWSKIFG